MGCCSSQCVSDNQLQTQTVIKSEPDNVTTKDTGCFSIISDDSCMNCISFLNPIDFAKVCCTCKNFQSLTSLCNRSTQQYWKKQCICLCSNTLSAIENNKFDTKDWFGLFMELQYLIVHNNCTLFQLYAYDSDNDEFRFLPMTLMDFSDGYVVNNPLIRYACS